MIDNVVIDTNIFVSALMKADTAPRQVLRSCLMGEVRPLMSNPLFSEYEDLMGRAKLFKGCILNHGEREMFLDDFLSVCKWINIYYLWRPNLTDEADNHLIELALAGNATSIVTGNKKDFQDSELLFPHLKIITAAEFVKERSA